MPVVIYVKMFVLQKQFVKPQYQINPSQYFSQSKTTLFVYEFFQTWRLLNKINDELFSRLEIPFPVIVTIGYQTDLRFDVISRTFDYTPVLPDGSKPLDERGRKGGGADLFAKFIEMKIKPKTESFVPINKQHQTIWGHSYGGLFVLNTLFKHPEMFQNYVLRILRFGGKMVLF